MQRILNRGTAMYNLFKDFFNEYDHDIDTLFMFILLILTLLAGQVILFLYASNAWIGALIIINLTELYFCYAVIDLSKSLFKEWERYCNRHEKDYIDNFRK
jgi:uncharacterized membrane protein